MACRPMLYMRPNEMTICVCVFFHIHVPPSDPSAVVDERLRVFGVRKLRVVDASILPTLTSGNTHAPVVAARSLHAASHLVAADSRRCR